ncbi:uncharacterized protein LAJ45_00071 [Morchella importuna]|uniref:uncharacterized protein n=1 Tax=Morchella importuna TaxID=1174673 RepID=UPI001E8CA520|nr:uncharacterized protein LAJ45_00071 [Morchella importuna]KAH8155062.1 hypothetical protein LAJ45_00071 [Morchella importuna]
MVDESGRWMVDGGWWMVDGEWVLVIEKGFLRQPYHTIFSCINSMVPFTIIHFGLRKKSTEKVRRTYVHVCKHGTTYIYIRTYVHHTYTCRSMRH